MASENRLALAKKISFEKIGALLAAIIVLTLFPTIKILIFSSSMVFIGVLSLQYQRFMRFFGFELCFFVTILCSLAYGPLIGAMVGILSYAIGQTIVGQISHYSLVTVIGFIACAMLCSLLGATSLPFVLTAMSANIASLTLMGIGWTIMGFPIGETIITSIVNIAINFVMFCLVGQVLLGVMR